MADVAGYDQLLRQGKRRDILKKQSEGGGEFLGILGRGMATEIPAGWQGIMDAVKAARRGAGFHGALDAGAEGVKRSREFYAPKGVSPGAESKLERLQGHMEQAENAANEAGWYGVSARNPLLAAGVLGAAQLVGPKGAKPKVPHAAEVPKPHVATWAETIADAERRMDVARDSGNRPSYDAWERVRQNAIIERMREGATPPAGAREPIHGPPARDAVHPDEQAFITDTIARQDAAAQQVRADPTPHERLQQRIRSDTERWRQEGRPEPLEGSTDDLRNRRVQEMIEENRRLRGEPADAPRETAETRPASFDAPEGGGWRWDGNEGQYGSWVRDEGGEQFSRPRRPGSIAEMTEMADQGWTQDANGNWSPPADDWVPVTPQEPPADLPRQRKMTEQVRLPSMEKRPPLSAAREDVAYGGANYDEARARANADAFLMAARENPELFQYGAEPPEGLRHMDDLAEHYSEQAGERVRVDMQPGEESDEPYKIKVPREHGRGEEMIDRHGEYKYEEAEAGDKLREQDTGDIKTTTKEVELVGPPDADYFERNGPALNRYGPALWGEKEIPKRASGGEMVFDEEGNPVYRLSEGGEPVRDERGRQKYDEEENPEYRSPGDEYVLSVAGKVDPATGKRGEKSVIRYDPEERGPEGGGVHATESKKGTGAGQLMYQLINSFAVRNGLNILNTSGLTGINALRLLGNGLSTFARHGENPRSMKDTLSGVRPPARGNAGGFDMWNAETGETEYRLRNQSADPNRIEFDGENFLMDGEPATAAQIDSQLATLSPRGRDTGVGTKTLMRSALMRWLETVTPEAAADVARRWGSKAAAGGVAGVAAGPIFAKDRDKKEESPKQ